MCGDRSTRIGRLIGTCRRGSLIDKIQVRGQPGPAGGDQGLGAIGMAKLVAGVQMFQIP